MKYERMAIATLAFILAACMAPAQGPQSGQRVFESPEAAVDAVVAACAANDTNGLIDIFGPLFAEESKSVDAAEEGATRSKIVKMAKEVRRIETRSDTERVVLLGRELWPFPMPIVSTGSGWQFDTEAGLDEILKRRVGRNELTAIDVCRTYVDAQEEYAEEDRDADGVLEYAQKITSAPGQKDGLYWEVKADSGEAPSPLGPFLAAAEGAWKPGQGEGYMGYRFRILTGQGKYAPGGKRSYLDGGNMTGGFALVAWPVQYGHSGVKTFMVSEAGAVYEKDLGSKTESAAARIKTFDPDPAWSLVTDDL